jgi:allantoate deiminase
VIGVALLEQLQGHRFPFAIEVIGFSEEEGVRFGIPFIGSRALLGKLDDELLETQDSRGIDVRTAMQEFGLDPRKIPDARLKNDVLGYIEFHIEQGPVLEELDLPLAVVETIAGQSRLEITFTGRANHAGTTPMHLRRDAIAGAAEWIQAVEREAGLVAGLVATVGTLHAKPGAANVIAGQTQLSLDVRHKVDHTRRTAVDRVIQLAEQIAARRKLSVFHRVVLDQKSMPMDPAFVEFTEEALRRTKCRAHRMASGAGHDAMVLAEQIPTAMMFLRSPGGISHHPDETVKIEDVAKALEAGMHLLEIIASSPAVQRRGVQHA